MRFKFLDVKDHQSKYFSELPSFYKYVVKDNSAFIPNAAMLERVFMPWNKRYSDYDSIFKFLNDLMPSLGRPGTNLLMFYKFYAYIYNKLHAEKKEELVNVDFSVKIHMSVYNKLLIELFLTRGVSLASKVSWITVNFQN